MSIIVNLGRKLTTTCMWQHQKGLASVSSMFFKSDLSLDKLYPNSKQSLFTPSPPAFNKESFNGFIPLDQLTLTYDRSSGPGGQNVNKVNTKVDLRFQVSTASWLNNAVKDRLAELNKSKINKEGFLIIKSDVTRFQQMNLADALEKLRCLIREAEKPAKVELPGWKMERVRRGYEKAARERLMEKRKRSDTKAQRKSPELS